MRIRPYLAFVLVALLLRVAAVHAQLDADALYSNEADVTLPADGVVRLPLSAETVALAGPALRDLRLVRDEGIETPFAVVSMPVDTSTETRTAAVVPLEASQTRRGTAPEVYVETYDLAVPLPPDSGGEWSLVLDIPAPRFTARITLSSAEARSVVVPETRTVFRLADGSSRTRVPLPSGATTKLRVVLEGESGFLSPTFSFVSPRAVSRPVALEVPVATTSVAHANGTTILELAPPGGLFVNGVRIDSRSVGYSRPVRIFARVHGEPFVEVGSGTISNVSGGGGETRSLAFASVAAERLRIVVEDGASPPLEAPSLALLVDQPSLVFDTQGSFGMSQSVRLVFGGRRAIRGPYAEEADWTRRARDESLPLATLGAVVPNRSYRAAPALSFAMRPGASVDPRGYLERARVTIPRTAEGLGRIALPLSVVAAAEDGVADVRLVDDRQRQWPYLIGEETLRFVDVRARSERRDGHESVSLIGLPGNGVHVSVLRIDPHAALVDRRMRIEDVSTRTKPVLLAETRLARLPGESGPIEVPLHGGRPRVLRVIVDDGDDAPLELGFSIGVELPVLYTAAPAGVYTLLVGRVGGTSDRNPPVYELERARALVMAIAPTDARIDPLERNPDAEPPSAFSTDRLRDVLLWAVLGFATLALFAFTIRLSRSESRTAPSDAPDER